MAHFGIVTAAVALLAMIAGPASAGSTRPLYVFAPSGGDARLGSQRAIVAGRSGGFADRDVPVIEVIGADPRRARFGVPAGQFRVILVGKDGGVKLSSGRPVPAAEIFALIDAMPMRRDEIRARGR
jgi:Domain of unknown function (DUF4174)